MVRMEPPTPQEYGRLWIRQALSKSWNIGDAISGLIGVAAGAIAHYSPAFERVVNGSLWELPIWALGATLLFRFLFFAPYELWKADREDRANSLATLTAVGLRRPLQQIRTQFEFAPPLDQPTLVGLTLFHRNTGDAPVRYILENVRLRVLDIDRPVNLGPAPGGLVQGDSEGWHRCRLIEPLQVPMLPLVVTVNFDYRYDTVPPVRERLTGATARYEIIALNPMTVNGAFYDEQREG